MSDEREDGYVAWCVYLRNDAGETYAVATCDDDTEGAFKVYRHPDADLTRLEEENATLRTFNQNISVDAAQAKKLAQRLQDEVDPLRSDLAALRAQMETVRERVEGLKAICFHRQEGAFRVSDTDFQAMAATLREIESLSTFRKEDKG